MRHPQQFVITEYTATNSVLQYESVEQAASSLWGRLCGHFLAQQYNDMVQLVSRPFFGTTRNGMDEQTEERRVRKLLWQAMAQTIGSFSVVDIQRQSTTGARPQDHTAPQQKENAVMRVTLQYTAQDSAAAATRSVDIPLLPFKFARQAQILKWIGATEHYKWDKEFEINAITATAILSHITDPSATDQSSIAGRIQALEALLEAGIKSGLSVSIFDLLVVAPIMRWEYIKQWMKQNVMTIGRITGNFVLSYACFALISYWMGPSGSWALSWAISYSIMKAVHFAIPFGENERVYGEDYNKAALIAASFLTYILGASISIPSAHGIRLLACSIFGCAVLETTWYAILDMSVMFLLYSGITAVIEPIMYDVCKTSVIGLQEMGEDLLNRYGVVDYLRTEVSRLTAQVSNVISR